MHTARQVFEIDLMHDADTRGHDLERIERLHTPFHELIALFIALEFEFHVDVERILAAVTVHLYRMIDHQIDRHQRLNHFRILAHLVDDLAHRRQISQQRNAGEILQHHARDDERNFKFARIVRPPIGELLHVLFADLLAIDIAQHRFQHDANRDRQFADIGKCLCERRQRIELAGFAGSEGEGFQGAEGVVGHGES